MAEESHPPPTGMLYSSMYGSTRYPYSGEKSVVFRKIVMKYVVQRVAAPKCLGVKLVGIKGDVSLQYVFIVQGYFAQPFILALEGQCIPGTRYNPSYSRSRLPS